MTTQRSLAAALALLVVLGAGAAARAETGQSYVCRVGYNPLPSSTYGLDGYVQFNLYTDASCNDPDPRRPAAQVLVTRSATLSGSNAAFFYPLTAVLGVYKNLARASFDKKQVIWTCSDSGVQCHILYFQL